MTKAGKTIRIGVIETGEVPDELVAQYGDYVAQMANWLGPWLPEAEFVARRVVRGEPLGSPGELDGYLITGSRHGAYDPLPWIAELEAFVRAAARDRIPVFGICFGHQVMAQAFGARVEKSGRGWGVGRQIYRLEGNADATGVHVFHQDQVLEVPEGAVVVGGNDFCPIGALEFPDANALSVQFHPEFDRAFVRALLEVRGANLPDGVPQAAEASLVEEPDNAAIARWAADFFRSALAGRRVSA